MPTLPAAGSEGNASGVGGKKEITRPNDFFSRGRVGVVYNALTRAHYTDMAATVMASGSLPNGYVGVTKTNGAGSTSRPTCEAAAAPQCHGA